MHKPLKPYFKPNTIEAGCDEAGRGCLAGPVVAAAVILSADNQIPELNDSKKLSPAKREKLSMEIKRNATDWAVSVVSPQVIDRMNILNASILAMHNAIDKLNVTPEFLLIDGNRFHTYKKMPHKCIIKGDAQYASVSAASILAKTCRDNFMIQLHNLYPIFNWKQNKGYPTYQHRKMIKKYGLTMFHRKTFKY